MYGKICHHGEEGRRMRILGTERTNKHFDGTGSARSQSGEEGHPPTQELTNRKSGHVEEWKWRCHLGIWGCCVRCTHSLSNVCGFKRCFLKSISEVPVPHSQLDLSSRDSHLPAFSDSPGERQRGFSPSTIHGSCPCSTLKITIVLVTGHPVRGKQHRTGDKVLGTNDYLTIRVCLLES